MAFDPQQEDFMRLVIATQSSAEVEDPYAMSRQASAFSQKFSWKSTALATTNEDQAFHLMSEAAEIIDAKLPFVDFETGESLATTARRLLEEALALDPSCYDAQRLIHAQTCVSMDEYLHYLEHNLAKVERDCEDRAHKKNALEAELQKIVEELSIAPYQRWLHSLAMFSLLSGHYRKSLEYAKRCIALDPRDPADARYTAVLAFAKLEDETGLETFVQDVATGLDEGAHKDPWLVIARMALAWKAGREGEARELLGSLLETYPMAATTLSELAIPPDPMFARLAVRPGSEDELSLAVGEAGVLFQEGADENGFGPLAYFVINDPRVQAAYEKERKFFGTDAIDDSDDAKGDFELNDERS